MDRNFEAYVETILCELNYNHIEKQELAEEMCNHLIMLKEDFMKQGITEKNAIDSAIKVFGEENAVKRSFRKSMFKLIFRKDNLIHNILLSVELSFLMGLGTYMSAEINPVHYSTDTLSGIITSPIWIIYLWMLSYPVALLLGVSFSVLNYQLFGKSFNRIKFFFYAIYFAIISNYFLKDIYTETILNRYLVIGISIGVILWFIDIHQRDWLQKKHNSANLG